MHLRGYAWNVNTGAVETGKTVTLTKRLPSGSAVDTTVTDADGMWEFQENGNPYGIVDIEVAGSTIDFSFGDVSLARVGGYDDREFADMLSVLSDGVVFGLDDELDASCPGGMVVRISTGACRLLQSVYRIYTYEDITVSANATGSTRSDGIFARLTRTGNDQTKTELVYKAGDLTETQTADTWEALLWQVDVPNAAASIVIGYLVDVRPAATFPIPEAISDSISALEADTAALTQFAMEWGSGDLTGSTPITTGRMIPLQLPDVATTIDRVTILLTSDGVGTPTITVDFLGETYADWDASGDPIESPGDSIVNTSGGTSGYGSALDASARTGTHPAVSADGKVTVTTFTGWRTSLGALDIIQPNISAIANVLGLTIVLHLTKAP